MDLVDRARRSGRLAQVDGTPAALKRSARLDAPLTLVVRAGQAGMVKRCRWQLIARIGVSVAAPVMRGGDKSTDEAIHLGIETMFYLHVIETANILRRAVSPPMRVPCFRAARADAIVSFLLETRPGNAAEVFASAHRFLTTTRFSTTTRFLP